MSITADQFGQAIIAAGLMTADGFATLVSETLAAAGPPQPAELADRLVAAGKLTKFQAEQLLAGKSAELVLGEYLLVDRIGAGGMGQVFKAQHRRMKRLVALKLLRTDRNFDEAANRRFQREVEAAAKLSHPNIVTAHDAGESNGRPYLVMEFVPGSDLSALVASRGPLPVDDALDYIGQAARGLAFAHGRGIVHRDVKPSNLLLDEEGVVKILDMGLARLNGALAAVEDGLTESGQLLGTIDYMAPEQAYDTHHADARADIYSLGCSLYRLLTAEQLYKKDTMVAKVIAHREAPIPELWRKRPEVSPQLEIVFRRMVAKTPDERYQTMNEVVSALDACRAARLSGVQDAPLSGLGTALADQPTRTWQPGATESKSRDTMSSSSDEERTEDSPLPSGDAQEVRVLEPAATSDRQALAKKHSRRRLLTALGLAGFVTALAGIIFIVRDRNGKEVGRIEAPDGSTVGIVPASSDSTSQISNRKSEISNPKSVLPAPSPAIAPFDAAKAKEIQEAWAKHLGVPVEITNSIGMKLLLIPPGEFEMGSPQELIDDELKNAPKDDKWYIDHLPGEGPRHHVRITKPFYLGEYCVTQEEYQRVMGASPSAFSATGKDKDTVAGQETKRFPVEQVSWYDTDEFCSRLSEMADEKSAARRYGLPTEAQWEYACRAGTTGRNYFVPASAVPAPPYSLTAITAEKKLAEKMLADYAWFANNSGGRPHAVGGRRSNPWGLYDMNGNVWHWCQDWYAKDYYAKSPVDDPVGPDSGSNRVYRGGTWYDPARFSRSASRRAYEPGVRYRYLGFRVSQVLAGNK